MSNSGLLKHGDRILTKEGVITWYICAALFALTSQQFAHGQPAGGPAPKCLGFTDTCRALKPERASTPVNPPARLGTAGSPIVVHGSCVSRSLLLSDTHSDSESDGEVAGERGVAPPTPKSVRDAMCASSRSLVTCSHAQRGGHPAPAG